MLNAVKASRSNPELVEQVLSKKDQLKLNQDELAKRIDISKAVLSLWLADKYQGSNDNVERKVKIWLTNLDAASKIKNRLPDAPIYFETPTSRRITAALAYAQMAKDLAVIHGGAGNSKTFTINKYAQENPNVWVVDATPCTSTPSGLLRTICHVLKERVSNRTVYKMEQQIRDRLRDTNGLLIIDEAQFLGERAIETIRRFADMAEVGVVLCGNDTVYAQLTNNSRRSAEFAQLFSRIGKRVRITMPTADDISALCDAWQISNTEAKNIISNIAKKPGALRMCTKVLRFASLIANGKNEAINSLHIKAAWNDLAGEL